jgi:hypothetical protein
MVNIFLLFAPIVSAYIKLVFCYSINGELIFPCIHISYNSLRATSYIWDSHLFGVKYSSPDVSQLMGRLLKFKNETIGKQRRKRENNIKMKFKGIEREIHEWIHLNQASDHGRILLQCHESSACINAANFVIR